MKLVDRICQYLGEAIPQSEILAYDDEEDGDTKREALLIWNEFQVNEFDNFDIAGGLYWYAVENHSGQWSDGYRALSKLSKVYRPSPLRRGPEDENAQAVYDSIPSEEVALALVDMLLSKLDT